MGRPLSLAPSHGGSPPADTRRSSRGQTLLGGMQQATFLLTGGLTFSTGGGGENLFAQARKMSGSGFPLFTSGSSPKTMWSNRLKNSLCRLVFISKDAQPELVATATGTPCSRRWWISFSTPGEEKGEPSSARWRRAGPYPPPPPPPGTWYQLWDLESLLPVLRDDLIGHRLSERGSGRCNTPIQTKPQKAIWGFAIASPKVTEGDFTGKQHRLVCGSCFVARWKAGQVSPGRHLCTWWIRFGLVLFPEATS